MALLMNKKYFYLNMQDKDLEERISIHKKFLDLHLGNRFMVDIPICVNPPKDFNAESIKDFWQNFVSAFPHRTDSKILNFYIHIPYCLNKCHYCFYGSEALNNKKDLDRYIAVLIKYFQYFEKTFNKITFANLYIGGGTPNILDEKQLKTLLAELFKRFKFDKDGEKTFEGDPRCSSLKKLKLLKKYGFNRISFGVQSFDKKVLKYNNRDEQIDGKVVKRAVDDVKKAGISHINLDMIVGLYGEEENSLITSFQQAIQLKPYSISVYPMQATDKYLKMFFDSNKTKFDEYRAKIINSTISKILEIAEENNYKCPTYSEYIFPMSNASSFSLINQAIRPLSSTYNVDSPDQNVSCFGLGIHSISKINGREFSYQMTEPLTTHPVNYIYKGIANDKKHQIAEYLVRGFASKKFISRADIRKAIGADVIDYFQDVLTKLKAIKIISIRGDKVYFAPKTEDERKKNILFFYDIDEIKARMPKEEIEPIQHDNKIKKTVIIAGYACNNNCIFCIHGDKRSQIVDKTNLQIKKEINEARNRGSTYLEIIGGEASTRLDILDLIKFAKKIGFSTIMMATNGRMYSYEEFTRKALQAGLNSLVFSIHGHNSELHDALTQAPGSFQQLKQGLQNAQKIAKDLNLDISLGANVCIVKQNYKYLPKIGNYIKKLGINNAEFIFIDPNNGAGLKSFNKLVPKISDAAPYIHKCLEIGKKNKIPHWHIRYVPLCYFQNYLDQISELQEIKSFHTEHIAPDFYNPNASEGRQNIGRIKTEKCQKCQLFNKCEGVWKEYFRHYGDAELMPIIDNNSNHQNAPIVLLRILPATFDLYINNIDLLCQRMKNDFNMPVNLLFIVSMEDILGEFRDKKKKMAVKKIKKIVTKLVKKNLDFSISPLPPCLFNVPCPIIIKKRILKNNQTYSLPPAFITDPGIKHSIDSIENMDIQPQCLSCQFKLKNKCRGIYIKIGVPLIDQKTQEWLKNKIESSKNITLLDCGSGANPPFLKTYKEIALGGGLIHLLEPDTEEVVGLMPAVSSYPSIIINNNTIEDADLQRNFFDIVILTGSYSHIHNLHKALLNIESALKQGGLLLIKDEMDTTQSEGNKIFDKSQASAYGFHYRNHSLKRVTAELEKYNFKVIEGVEGEAMKNKHQFWAIKAEKNSYI